MEKEKSRLELAISSVTSPFWGSIYHSIGGPGRDASILVWHTLDSLRVDVARVTSQVLRPLVKDTVKKEVKL